MASDPVRPLTRERLRTPRSAAFAGIVFSLLIGTTMVLIQVSIPLSTLYEPEWLVERSGRSTE